MRGRNKIDVMASAALKKDHVFGKIARGYLLSCSEMADIVVLAEDAEKIAVGEEDGS